MSRPTKKELDEAIARCVSDLEELLKYSKTTMSKVTLGKYPKQKTVYKFNIFSGIYQRIDGIIHLINGRQANAANILLRSIWELLVANDFVEINRSNYFIEVSFALAAKNTEKQWRQIKRIRAKYPSSNTWQERWSDDVLDKRINSGVLRLQKFSKKYPHERLGRYDSLLSRLEAIDDHHISKNPSHESLTQMDYYTVYSILSEDVHSTVFGTINNSRAIKGGMEIRLDRHDLNSIRCTTTAYSMLLNYINHMTRRFKLRQAKEIRDFRRVEKDHEKLYISLERK